LIESLLPHLHEDNYELAVEIAELPDMIRGYEAIKLAAVAEFHQKVEALRRQFHEAESAVQTV
jgi:indolepyruvate ferredoxin oxidoreductase